MNFGMTRRVGAHLAMALVMGLALVEPAAAAGIQDVLQKIVEMLQGGIIRLLAILAVIIVGIAWMFGFMDMRRAGQCIVGIAIVFGAAELVDMVAG